MVLHEINTSKNVESTEQLQLNNLACTILQKTQNSWPVQRHVTLLVINNSFFFK